MACIFFVTLDNLLALGIKNKKDFILFCPRFFVTLQALMILAVVILYLLVLFVVSRYAAGDGSNGTFFRARRGASWYMVAFGMVGASISGITFVSVPGMVLHSGMTYLQTCLGFILGYFVVAFVLLPVYYRLNLTSIYTVLRDINEEAYKTGAAYFIFSKLLGSAAKFFVPCYILSEALGTDFFLTMLFLYALIWLYTKRGGIRTLVWTDTVQTLCMLVALALIMHGVYAELGFASVGDCLAAIAATDYARVFEFSDWDSTTNFFKCFISGIFIVVVMTGLDQDMMQKNLTCRTLRDAQKDMCSYGFAFVPVNAMFLILGIMLAMLCAKTGTPLPERADALLPMFAADGRLGSGVLIFFTIGVIATSFSTVDSALTALTTSFCVDILGMSQSEEGGKARHDEKVRRRVHLGMTLMLAVCTELFALLGTESLIDTIYRLVGYTYGPLLGLFAYSLIHRKARGGFLRYAVALTCVLSPFLCFALDMMVPRLTGYHFGYELLLLNGMITYIGLKISNAVS